MCMEDVRMGRRSLSRSLPVTVGAAAGEVLSGSLKRIAVILGSPLAGTITYLDTAPTASGLGYNVGAGQPPITLSIQVEGEIVTHQWWAIADAGGRVAAVGETILNEE